MDFDSRLDEMFVDDSLVQRTPAVFISSTPLSIITPAASAF